MNNADIDYQIEWLRKWIINIELITEFGACKTEKKILN